MTFLIISDQATTPCPLFPPPWVPTPSLCLSEMSRVLTGQCDFIPNNKFKKIVYYLFEHCVSMFDVFRTASIHRNLGHSSLPRPVTSQDNSQVSL